jgi:hypothetical protein
MYRSSAQNINKATSELNDTIYQIYLTDIYWIFHPTVRE